MRVAVAFTGLACACALPSAPGVACGRAAGAPQAAGAIPRLLGGPSALEIRRSAVAPLRGGAAVECVLCQFLIVCICVCVLHCHSICTGLSHVLTQK